MTADPAASADAQVMEHLRRAVDASDYPTARGELERALKGVDLLKAPIRSDVELTVWMTYSVVAERYGDVEAAIKFNEKLALAQPDDATSLLALARLYRNRGDEDAAASSIIECSERAQRFSERTVLGILAAKGILPEEREARRQRIEDAIAVYTESVATITPGLSPNSYASIRVTLGTLSEMLAELMSGVERTRKLQDSRDAYREALAVYTELGSSVDGQLVQEKLARIESLLT